MTIKDPIKFKQYYIGVFKGLESTGRTYFPEVNTPIEKAEAAIKSGHWIVKILPLSLAKVIDSKGYLNVGICPECGEAPIGQDSSWPYYWSWNNGPSLYLCKSCYDIGLKAFEERNKENKKGCYIATVCYGDENAHSVVTLKWYRDNVLKNGNIGKMIIALYYFFSPTIANFLQNKKLMNQFIKTYMLKPIVSYITEKYDK